MYVTRCESMRISSSTDTTCYCLLNHKVPSPPDERQYKDAKPSGMAKRQVLLQRFIKSINRSATIPNTNDVENPPLPKIALLLQSIASSTLVLNDTLCAKYMLRQR